MALVYFDSSAFAKLLLDEAGSETVVDLWDGCDLALSSRLAYPEVRAGLAAARRAGRLDASDLAYAERAWERYWDDVSAIALTPALSRAAGELAKRYALSGADAVHLASAKELEESDFVMAVWDRRLRDAASVAGIRLAPATLG